jgi:hypothetical protein
MVTISLPYIVVKVFKRNCFLRCLEKKRMKIFAKINGIHCVEFPHQMRKFVLNLALGEPLALV